MIPESEGATPFGIFLLADAYLHSAQAVEAVPRIRIGGPVRLLCFHACELYLKCFLRANGATIVVLRDMGHDLHEMAIAAQAGGLAVKPDTLRQLAKLAERNDYVRARYVVSDVPGDLKPRSALILTEKLRELVRLALKMDPFGNPS